VKKGGPIESKAPLLSQENFGENYAETRKEGGTGIRKEGPHKAENRGKNGNAPFDGNRKNDFAGKGKKEKGKGGLFGTRGGSGEKDSQALTLLSSSCL